jgi:hypothetical protein
LCAQGYQHFALFGQNRHRLGGERRVCYSLYLPTSTSGLAIFCSAEIVGVSRHSVPPKWPQDLGERRSDGPEFLQMNPGKLSQPALAFFGQFHQNASSVALIDASVQQAQSGHPIHKLDRGMMADQKIFREIADGNGVAAGKAPDGQKHLMLLRRQASLVGGGLAEGLKFPQFVSEPGERFIVHGIGRVAMIRRLAGAAVGRPRLLFFRRDHSVIPLWTSADHCPYQV